jgi:hypothetical protein
MDPAVRDYHRAMYNRHGGDRLGQKSQPENVPQEMRHLECSGLDTKGQHITFANQGSSTVSGVSGSLRRKTPRDWVKWMASVKGSHFTWRPNTKYKSEVQQSWFKTLYKADAVEEDKADVLFKKEGRKSTWNYGIRFGRRKPVFDLFDE